MGIKFNSLLYKTNRFHVAVGLFSNIITNPHEILLFSVCIKSTIVVFNMAKQLSEENGGGPFC